MKLYEYKGNISGGSNREITLCVLGNDEIPPTRLTVPAALGEYISGLLGADSEEKYYKKIYKYNRILALQEIVIPTAGSVPAKIITQAKFTSEDISVFGDPEQMELPQDELKPMSSEEYGRYIEFRRENPYDKFYYM